MSDPRFARLKSDPRFRRIHKKESKVVVDERFAGLFDDAKGKKKQKKGKGRVDKYGRALSDTHEKDNLRRFYRLEGEDEDEEKDEEEEGVKKPDYARGEVLLESSDEEDGGKDDESDDGGVVTLRRVEKKHILDDDDEPEVDLDEDNFADLDAQAAEYAKEHEEEDEDAPEVARTRRIAVVNLDWDHVRAIHLYKIFSSLVSPTAPAVSLPSAPAPNEKKGSKGGAARVVRGKILSVRVYPSQFGKERMAKEEKEGPPVEVFKKRADGEEVVRGDDSDVGDAEDYNEEALRKYQLERLRYYYAIVECDTVGAASHVYSELEGTELERSANVFDLSFVPDEMTFDDEPRDEATSDVNAPYKPVEFVTDALRHSKVKLTWDDDDPERNQLTRRALTRKEIEENDFRAYLASSSDESDAEPATAGPSKGKADRDRLRALLLGGGDDALPEGWGNGEDDKGDVDMEITFTPGLSETKGEEDETTLEKYKRKMKEKKKKRKEERKEKGADEGEAKGETKRAKPQALDDDFFAEDSGDESAASSEDDQPAPAKKGKKGKRHSASPPPPKVTSTAEELALVATSDNPNAEPKHFDMKAVLKAEKAKGKKRKGKKGKKGAQEEEPELQEDFAIDVKDDRFKAVHEDHTFAIDPSNPHFKKTKNMSALLQERSKRQKEKVGDLDSAARPREQSEDAKSSLKNLVESVKRKSAAVEQPMGKRRKL